MKRPSWDQRITRAEKLRKAFPFAADILGFYVVVARFQGSHDAHIRQARRQALRSPCFSENFDLSLLLPQFPGFLQSVKEAGPAQLSNAAEQLLAETESLSATRLRNFWQHTEVEGLTHEEVFFSRAFLQPYAEIVAEWSSPNRLGNSESCPICASEPVVGVLREEQLGAKRSFICSLCAHEWAFPRSVCPGCGEDRNHALAVFTSELFEHIRVDACDTCKCYIKTVDLTRDGLAIPVVDELSAIPLTLWANLHGYTKLQPNLLAV